jgi:hypothetical protein
MRSRPEPSHFKCYGASNECLTSQFRQVCSPQGALVGFPTSPSIPHFRNMGIVFQSYRNEKQNIPLCASLAHNVGEHAQRTILQCITAAAVHATAVATVLMPELLFIPSALQSGPVPQLQGETLMRSCIVLAATNTVRYYDDCKDGKHQQVVSTSHCLARQKMEDLPRRSVDKQESNQVVHGKSRSHIC